MGSRLGRRVVNFANLPIKLLMPKSFDYITEIAIKTIPSASKIEIKRVLESMYGFEVDKVSTLNMEGKKKKRGGFLMAHPDYKKAYVTLKNPLSISPDLYPIRMIEEERKRNNRQSKSSIVEKGKAQSHWLDGKGGSMFSPDKVTSRRHGQESVRSRHGQESGRSRRGRDDGRGASAGLEKFPWSNMQHPRLR